MGYPLDDADFNGVLVRWAPEAHAALALFFVRECDQKAHDYVAYAAEGKTNERGRNNFGEWGQHLGGDIFSMADHFNFIMYE